MQQPGDQTWNGGHRFQMGGRAPQAPPLAMVLGSTEIQQAGAPESFAPSFYQQYSDYMRFDTNLYFITAKLQHGT